LLDRKDGNFLPLGENVLPLPSLVRDQLMRASKMGSICAILLVLFAFTNGGRSSPHMRAKPNHVGQVANLRADWQSARVAVANRHAA